MKRLILLVLLSSPLLAAEPRKFIVEFTTPPDVRGIRTEAERAAAAKRFRSDAADVDVRREFSRAFHGVAVELREGQSVDALSRMPYVAAIHPDSEVIAYAGDASKSRRVTAPSLRTNGGAGIVVAVIDTGVDSTHPALAGKVIGGYDFVNDDADPMDDHRHGTHVAGIIAAESAAFTGVAPGVRLLAYKVLNAEGRGTVSGVIAAIERALDPNGDGDLSDGADIANVSLGDRGRPDDPLSRAVDNAVAAGMIVCVAAGNDETFHRIGSPAGAAKAITVGASTIEDGIVSVAYFTSRGPATQSGAIKPDLIAPGRDIRSTGLDHGYIVLSGTSMATPHVAGYAALLLEEHPHWTPERVKAALVTTARAVVDEEVMTQGTGVADVSRARVNTLVASPTQINFGLDGITAASWSSTRRIAIRNDGETMRTIRASVEGATAAMTMAIVPSEVTLAAGQTVELEVTIGVDHAILGKPLTRSFAFGGVLAIQSAGEEVRVPWAFVRAGRATITNEGGTAGVLWRSDLPRYASPANIGGGGVELLLEPGMFDFVVASQQNDELRLVIAEQQQIEGDVTLAVTAADAPHEIRFDGADERGTPFPDGDGTATLRSLLLRLLMPNAQTTPLPDITGRVIRTSSFSERFGVLATESFVDRAAARVHVAQYAPLFGVAASEVVQVTPGDYAAQEVELHFPDGGARREVGIMPRDWPRRPTEHRLQPPSLRFAANVPTWKGTLLLTKEVHDDFASGVQLSLHTADDANAPASLITPMIRRDDDGFFAARGFAQSPLSVRSVAGEAFSFGRGAIHLPGLLFANGDGFLGDAEIYGARGDRRRNDTMTGKIRVFDENGAQVASGNVAPQSFFLPLPRTGRFRAEIRFAPFAMDDRIGEAMLTTRFDTTQGIASLPAITSFAILDGAGRHATRLPVNGNGAFVFSAAGHELGEYRRVMDDATNVFFRRRHTNTWVELTPVATGAEETGDELGRPPAGVVYRVDLSDALRLGAGEYEIMIETGDERGNSTSWQIAPAFIVEVQTGLRRRAAGK